MQLYHTALANVAPFWPSWTTSEDKQVVKAAILIPLMNLPARGADWCQLWWWKWHKNRFFSWFCCTSKFYISPGWKEEAQRCNRIKTNKKLIWVFSLGSQAIQSYLLEPNEMGSSSYAKNLGELANIIFLCMQVPIFWIYVREQQTLKSEIFWLGEKVL